MHYSNHDNRQQRPEAAACPAPQKFLSLERGAGGLRLRVRTAATMARLKLVPFGLPAALAVAACLTPLRVAKAQLGYDPFAGNLSHSEEKWAPYASADTGGINRPTSVAVNGVDTGTTNSTSFNIGVTAPNPSNAFLTSGGNIYSPTSALTLTLNGGTGQTVAPRYLNTVNSGSGMGASAQSAFQFDLSSYGGSNNITITVPGSASSVSFSSAQLDATTTVFGATNVVPEPSSVAIVLTALGGVMVAALRIRRRS